MPKITSNTNNTIRSKIPTSVDVLLVAAGGAGSLDVPGKGGQVLEFTSNISVGRNYIIRVGIGAENANGGNTSAFGQTALGGSCDGSDNFIGNGNQGVTSVITKLPIQYGADGQNDTNVIIDGSGNGGGLSMRGSHGVVIVAYPSLYSPALVIGDYDVNVVSNTRIYTLSTTCTFLF